MLLVMHRTQADALRVSVLQNRRSPTLVFVLLPDTTPQYLYTLCVTDKEKADKLTQSLPPGLHKKQIQ